MLCERKLTEGLNSLLSAKGLMNMKYIGLFFFDLTLCCCGRKMRTDRRYKHRG